jgi:hypothetical protein
VDALTTYIGTGGDHLEIIFEADLGISAPRECTKFVACPLHASGLTL